MLSFCERSGVRRREFLRAGGLALGGLSLSQLLQVRAAADQTSRVLRDRSVVFVFMHGGPSQIETFDPKMTAPREIASVNGEIATALPGITFGSSFPRLAAMADQLAIVRSFQTGDGIHNVKPVVSRHSADANIGSLYARVAGTNRPDSGMPTNVSLFPRAVDETAMPAFKGLGDIEATGAIGSAYGPFSPSGGAELQQNMQLSLPMTRLDDRRTLLTGLDRMRRELDAGQLRQSLDGLRQQAFDTLLGGVASAFDLSQEDPQTIARYDTAPLVHPDTIDTKWNNHKRYRDDSQSLGKLMLLARRLCERGAGFVTVTTNFVWDMHADANNAGMEEGLKYLAGPFDHAIATFLDDVRERGLSEKILLVCCGEMGRTPKLNAKGGRDHWGNLAPLLIAGGGLSMGQVIGRSDAQAASPASEPFGIPNLIATILNSLLDVGELRLQPGVPREVLQAATAAEPIHGLR
jgi:uncharacterized protein (DUF1501 family)